MTVTADVRELEPNAEWRAADVVDPETWTLRLTSDDHAELDHALRSMLEVSDDPLALTRDHFPLDGLVPRLEGLARELVDGRGFARISALDVDRYSDHELTLLYWGIGLHLGDPWPQNKYGHVLGDVTDQGKGMDDPTARGNELGGIALDYHTDGSDLVGLLCLRPAREGGLSCVANAVAIHNELVRTAPDLAAALYDELPQDLRGEQKPGGKPYFMTPAFTRHDERLWVRLIPAYIHASQRHPEAPRLTDVQKEALSTVVRMARDPDFNVTMDLRPGEMQFINNYHVLHGRTAYVDDPEHGRKRHLKRLWLATHLLTDRPARFSAPAEHWMANRSVSNLPPVARADA